MFKWDEQFSVGHKIIDAQHKKIFELGSEVEKVIATYDGSDIQSNLLTTVNALLEYTQYHFTEEEQIMTLAHYKHLDNHIEKHNKIIEKLKSLDFNIPVDEQGALALSLLQLIAEWIFEHIQGDDFAYINTLNKYINTDK